LAETFRQDFVSNGGIITREETYKTGDRDFSRQLTALKETQPEIIFLPSYYAEAVQIITQARQAAVDVPFLGTDGWDSPEFLRIGGKAVDNTYFANHFSHEEGSERVTEFSLKFSEKYGNQPPPLAALAYDAVMLAASAIRTAANEDKDTIRQALAATKDFPGVTGDVTFDENRTPRKPAIVIRVQDGTFSYLETVQP
jgi:branched-chain amino acid transport system substrate-binding protein